MSDAASPVRNVCAYVFIPLTFLLPAGICLHASNLKTKNDHSISEGAPEYLVVSGVTGTCGGTLVTSRRSEPKTLNPLIAIDGVSKELIGLLNSDLIHINRYTQQTEPALASSWRISPDGRSFTVYLRRGIRFSNGQPFDADDVLFTFRAYLDEKIHSPQRDLFTISGKPISVSKISRYEVAFTLPQPYAAAERLFDSVDILPRHLLEATYSHGELASAWNVTGPPSQMAGLGPFQLEEYRPGQRIVLRKNPFYWKEDREGNRLPYLDQIVSVSVATPEADELAFRTGSVDLISRFDPQDFSTLQNDAHGAYRVYDAGPGLEYTFLVFNLNDVPAEAKGAASEKQRWFHNDAFRQAISLGVDRDAMVRLAYSGRACPLSVQVSPGNRKWLDTRIPAPVQSIDRAQELLRQAHFSWTKDGSLKDASGRPVEFTILHNANRPQHARIAAMLQEDLKQLGIKANPAPMDFISLVDRVFNKFNYDTAIMTLADGDADPNTEMNFLLSTGQAHVWRLKATSPPEDWQIHIDQLMRKQMTTLDQARRRELFDDVQEIMWRETPVVFLLSPDILAGASKRVQNFKPAVLSSYTLWNADELSVARPHKAAAN